MRIMGALCKVDLRGLVKRNSKSITGGNRTQKATNCNALKIRDYRALLSLNGGTGCQTSNQGSDYKSDYNLSKKRLQAITRSTCDYSKIAAKSDYKSDYNLNTSDYTF